MHHPLPPSWAVTTSETSLGDRSFAVTARDGRDSRSAESSRDLSRLARQATISLGGNFAARALNFLNYAILARLLGPASLGLYAIGIALLQMFEGVARLGMSNGVIRLGTRYRRTAPSALKQVLTVALTLTGGCGLLVAGGLWVLAPWIASEIFGKGSLAVVIRWFAGAVPFVAMLRVVAAATRVTLRTQYSVWASEIVPGIVNLLLLVVFLAGWGGLFLVRLQHEFCLLAWRRRSPCFCWGGCFLARFQFVNTIGERPGNCCRFRLQPRWHRS